MLLPAVEQLLQPHPLLPPRVLMSPRPSPRPSSPRHCGTINDVCTAGCVAVNVPSSGETRLWPTNYIREVCVALIESYGLSCHLYVADTQVDGSCPVAAVDTLSSNVSACVRAISSWVRSSRLLLNPTKRRRCGVQQAVTAIHVLVGVLVTPSQSVRDLGVYLR